MATQAVHKALILVGAGSTGSIIFRNGRLSEVLGELKEMMQGANEGDSSIDVSILAARIKNLAQEVRDIKLSQPVAILNGGSSSSGLASYIMPAAAVGVMGYCYMWWKDLLFSDLIFLTRRTMEDAVAIVSKKVENVYAVLVDAERRLTRRLENLDGKLDEHKETSKLIMNEITEAKTSIGQIEFDTGSIRKMLSSVEGEIELLEAKQDLALRGIYYLCKFADGTRDGINTKLFQEVREKLPPTRSSSTFPLDKSVLLKGLEYFTESKQIGDSENSKPILHKDPEEKPRETIIKAATLLRTYPMGVLPKFVNL